MCDIYSNVLLKQNLPRNKFWELYNGVTNLSDIQLSNLEVGVLGKGLKYCPTPGRYDHGPLKESIDSFFRSVSHYLFFQNNEFDNTCDTEDIQKPFEHPDLKLPSTFNPQMPSNLEHIYHTFIDQVLAHNPSHKRRRNLKKSEYAALSSLGVNESIVIKKADKGSNIVIMNKSDYIREGLRQLMNQKFYRKLKLNPTDKCRKKAISLIEDMFSNHEISAKTMEYLKEGGERTSQFYMLPKIHKRKVNEFPPG